MSKEQEKQALKKLVLEYLEANKIGRMAERKGHAEFLTEDIWGIIEKYIPNKPKNKKPRGTSIDENGNVIKIY